MESAKHILFVDDAGALRDGLTGLLELKGYRVSWAANGREALDYLRRTEPPELILLDLMMPVMDGWQFRREQQQDQDLASIPVVLVSAADDVSRSASVLDAADYLKKPVGLDELVDVIRRNC